MIRLLCLVSLIAGLFVLCDKPVTAQMLEGIVNGQSSGGGGGGGGGSSVSLAASGTWDTTFGNASPVTDTSLTIPSALSNPTLVVFVDIGEQGVTPTVTWNGVDMGSPINNLYDGNFSATLFVYCLANPASGNNTLSVSYTGSPFRVGFGGYVFSNTHTAAPCNGFQSGTAPGAQTLSLPAITSATNDLTVAFWAETANTNFTTFNGTQIFAESSGGYHLNASSYNPGASTVTMTANITAGSPQGISGIGINLVAGP